MSKVGNRSANARAARKLNQLVESYTGNEQIIVLDARDFTAVTVGWSQTSSSGDTVRVGRVTSSTSTGQMSTGTWDLMSVVGTSQGSVTSTAVDWPWIMVATDTGGSSVSIFHVALSK